MTISTGNWK